MNFHMIDVEDRDLETVLEDAGERLENIAALWKLLGEDDRAERLLSWATELEARAGSRDGQIDLGEIADIIELIGDPLARSEEMLTHHVRLRPEAIERIMKEAPQLVTYDDLGGGLKLPSLNTPLNDAVHLTVFLQRAFDRGSRIAAD